MWPTSARTLGCFWQHSRANLQVLRGTVASLLTVTQEAQAQTWRLCRHPSASSGRAPPAPLAVWLRRGLQRSALFADLLTSELVPDSRGERCSRVACACISYPFTDDTWATHAIHCLSSSLCDPRCCQSLPTSTRRASSLICIAIRGSQSRASRAADAVDNPTPLPTPIAAGQLPSCYPAPRQPSVLR